jgi:hypothetical protein
MDNDIKYRVTILCPWHETGTSGFPTALAAYEYVAQMDDLTREDVISIKIERYDPAEEAKWKPEVV